MAWVTPTTRTTGTLITAAIWNQDVVNNPLLLKSVVTDAGGLRRSTIATTTATTTYEHDIETDLVAITAGDVTVRLATTTASSTGRTIDIKNLGTGTVRVYSPGLTIEGSTSTSLFTLTSEESITLFRLTSSQWVIL